MSSDSQTQRQTTAAGPGLGVTRSKTRLGGVRQRRPGPRPAAVACVRGREEGGTGRRRRENAARAVLAGRGAAAHAGGKRGCEIEIEMEAGTYVHRKRFGGGVLGGVGECAAEEVFCDID